MRGPNAQHGKIFTTDDLAERGLDIVVDPEAERSELERREAGQRGVPVPQLTICAIPDVREAIRVHAHDRTGIRDRQRAQEERVREAEDGGVDANAERESHHSDERIPTFLYQQADCEADILKKVLHERLPFLAN